jgi:hypothetical protein
MDSHQQQLKLGMYLTYSYYYDVDGNEEEEDVCVKIRARRRWSGNKIPQEDRKESTVGVTSKIKDRQTERQRCFQYTEYRDCTTVHVQRCTSYFEVGLTLTDDFMMLLSFLAWNHVTYPIKRGKEIFA